MNVKLCGLTRADDVAHAATLGATHVGLVVQAPKSHRNLDLDRARRLAEQAPHRLRRVLVTPTSEIDAIREALDTVPVEVVQATGDLAPDELREVADATGVDVWRGLRLAEDRDATRARIEDLQPLDAVVLDALSGAYGGHGETIDWSKAAEVVDAGPTDVVLAGGLTPDNVDEAIEAVDPWCVDVSSGIETDETNDPDKMAAFTRAAQEADP